MSEQPCPNCGRLNRSGARFCATCQLPLSRTGQSGSAYTGRPCPRCRAANSSAARFCNTCGTALQSAQQRPKGATGALSLHTILHNRYAVEGLLGKGGMGAVYSARDTRLGDKRWAVKEMSTAGLATAEELGQGVDAFRREAAMLASLSHRNLPKVIDNFEENGREYLVMELVEGRTLSDLLKKRGRPLPVDQVLGWGEQLCDVLGYLHNLRPPIIFRDLKPDNIMVDKNGDVKLIDFGIARHFTPGKSRDTVPFGTAGYAPPEQYGKGQTDARSDVYALAATLHQLLTGRDPSQDPFNFPPAQQLNSVVPGPLSSALQKALATAAADRWDTMEDFRRALNVPAPVKPPPSSPRAIAPSAAAARPASPVAQPASVQAAPPAVAKPASVARKRSGWLGYVLIVGGLAAVSMQLQHIDVVDQLEALIGEATLANLIYLTLIWMLPVLAYMLTRRPLAAFLVFFLAAWAGGLDLTTDFRNESLRQVLIMAGAMEAMFLLSGYRARGAMIGIVAPVVGAVAGLVVTLARYGNLPGSSELVVLVVASLVGGALAALLATLAGRG